LPNIKTLRYQAIIDENKEILGKTRLIPNNFEISISREGINRHLSQTFLHEQAHTYDGKYLQYSDEWCEW